jgi:hypothetical protein
MNAIAKYTDNLHHFLLCHITILHYYTLSTDKSLGVGAVIGVIN